MKKLIAITCMLFCTAVLAQEWVEITKSRISVYSIKANSARIATNDSGVKVILATGRITTIETEKIEAAMWYVPVDHCLRQRGTLVSTDVVGNFIGETQFVVGLGNVASVIAEIMCLSVDSINKRKSLKLDV